MTCFIFATGPSFLREDAEQARWCHTIAVNCAVFYTPWADQLYACDLKWWRHYGPMIPWYRGEKWCFQKTPGVEKFHRPRGFGTTLSNSGHQALLMAHSQGHKVIGLLGFDHQHTKGKKHVHGDHPERMGNAAGVDKWVGVMNQTAEVLGKKGITVINCSRDTALTCFPRMTVEEFNAQYRDTEGLP